MCQLAKDHGCKFIIEGSCYVYIEAGVESNNRRGYCPVADVPKKVVQKQKERTGQQKSKKKK